jgi:hypothetical protein
MSDRMIKDADSLLRLLAAAQSTLMNAQHRNLRLEGARKRRQK